VAFRSLWGSNADAISVLYAGTPALKGDFTRTGKRTKRGVLADGLNSARRYIINNFADKMNQAAVEAFIGVGSSGSSGGSGEGGGEKEMPSSSFSVMEPEITPTEARFWIRCFESGGDGSSGNASTLAGGDDSFWYQQLERLVGPTSSSSSGGDDEEEGWSAGADDAFFKVTPPP